MFRPSLARTPYRLLSQLPRAAQSRQSLSTAPPHLRSRSWRNAAIRWGLAGGLVYFYSTSAVFADTQTADDVAVLLGTEIESETALTVDQIAAQRQALKQSRNAQVDSPDTNADAAASGSPEDLEQEAGQQGAFNEETGEINWDCPCLGGMAHGPCGDQFRDAFSCFFYSKEELKGVDCVEKFKAMQDCFREHPDIYGAELEDDEPPNTAADAAVVETGEPSSMQATATDNASPAAEAKEVETRASTDTVAQSQDEAA